MSGRAIVLNGGSSSGKTTIARALQDSLPGPWLVFGIDMFIGTAPPELLTLPDGLGVPVDGVIGRGPSWLEVYETWRDAIATFIAAGTNVILDEVFLDGEADRRAWSRVLADDATLWVGVRCDADEADRREQQRGDRPVGIARVQASAVHDGMIYDVDIDMSTTATATAVETIVAAVRERWPA
jgi:chloramphenicol 3-O phosphotransferase